jgi:hypothetical protein
LAGGQRIDDDIHRSTPTFHPTNATSTNAAINMKGIDTKISGPNRVSIGRFGQSALTN